jgi:hypothetical protein
MGPLLLGAVAASATLWAAPGGGDDRALQAATGHLARATRAGEEGGSLATLAALRQMRERSLRPLFLRLSREGPPAAQFQAILALAEIDDDGRVDPRLVTLVESPPAQRALVMAAIHEERLDLRGLRELAHEDALAPAARVLVLAALCARGEAVDRAELRRLSGSPAPETAGVAACALAQLGDDEALREWRARLEEYSAERRWGLVVEVIELAAALKLTSAAGWVAAELRSGSPSPAAALLGVAALLRLDAAKGLELWREALRRDPSEADCIRYGLILLRSAANVDPSAWDDLPSGEPLLDHLAAAGRALGGRGDVGEAPRALLDLHHAESTRAVIEAAAELPSPAAAALLAHVIESIETTAEGRSERAELAIPAAARLGQLDPDALLALLLAVPDDSLTQEVMLLGLLETHSPAAGEAARQVPRQGFGRADLLALLLVARHSDHLEPRDLDRLAVIAAGGGSLSEALEAQAACLYLRHSGQIDAALAAASSP